ncbi:peptidase M56 [Massilia sp. RP-1-19]|uniref:Peptidase M56 n=1 Tax=Massilia polaris TaxID=2728846 RepID=A0A848HM99_9BURK|nr:M56 family metallopeptidase [Massilia polaris]NML62495.1 peptidase M56 [Massilia polaris]
MSALLPALAWALLDFVWQGLLIGWGAALVLAAMRTARPQSRYAVACAALLLCAALPLAGVIERNADVQALNSTFLPLASADAGQGVSMLTSTEPATLLAGRLAGWEQALQARLPLVVLLWSCGAALLALRMAVGLAWVRRLTSTGQHRADPAWQARLDRMAAGFGISRRVVLGLVDDIQSPVTAGWWRPVVLVPASLISGMPPQLLEALLAHELAHIRRHDYLVNLVQGAIEIVLFYHPTVWWLSSRIRVEREQVADDLAASMLGEPRRLALALSELDQFQFSIPQLAHAAHGGNLMSRIKRLVRPDTEPLNWKMALPALGLAAAFAGFYVHAQSTPPTPPAPPVPSVADMPAPPAPPAAPAAAKRHQLPEPPAPPAPPAPPPPPPKWSVDRAPGELSYAIVRADERGGTSMNGHSDDFDDLKAAKRAVKGEFLWFRDRNGKAYIVQDAGIMARVHKAWEPLDRLGKKMDVHGKEMDQHGKVMESLGREMTAAAPATVQSAAMRSAERDIEALGREQEKLGRDMEKLGRAMAEGTPAQRDSKAREMDRLAAKMDVLSHEMDKHARVIEQESRQIEKASKPMEAIGARMEQAGRPMEAIGKKMEVLGKQMETESRAAGKTVRSLIDEAISKGLAKPAPGSGAS